MRMRYALVRPIVWLAAASLLPLQAIPLAQTPAAKPAVPPKPAGDVGWPRVYANQQGQLVIYEPQIAQWRDQQQLTLHAAVAYTPSGTAAPLIGTVIAEANTRVAVEERLVEIGRASCRERGEISGGARTWNR